MVIKRIQNWYGKYERPISSLALVGGFVVDALTIRAVSLFWQNVWILANLIIISSCVILVHIFERNEGDESDSSKIHFWLVNILQFFFGSTLSTFLVFYFNSSDFLASWPFLLILALSFWANEKFKRNYVRLGFQIALLFLVIYSFAIFLVPMALNKIGNGVFLLSGIVSLVSIGFILFIIKYFSKPVYIKSKKIIYLSIGFITLLINGLYFTHLIPPIPLSLKSGGVYHSLKRNGNNYLVKTETKNWSDYFNFYPEFHKSSGETVFVYSAIFSPPSLNTTIVHEWQKLEAETGDWVTKNTIELSIIGGRTNGFRTYSQKSIVAPGKWRVNVLTLSGLVIGRIRFNIVDSVEKPELVEEIK